MCKLLRMSLLCLLLLFMFCTSVSFASTYYANEFTQISYNGSLYDFGNQLMQKSALGKTFEEFVGWVSTSGISSSLKTNYTNWTNDVITILSQPSTYNVYILIKPHPSNFNDEVIQFYYNNSNLSNSLQCYGFGYHKRNGTPYMERYVGSGALNPRVPSTGTGYNSWLWNKSKYFAANVNTIESPANNLKYTSYKTSTMLINMSGDNVAFNKADYNITDSIDIGYLTNIQYFDNIKGYLSVYSGTSNIDNANYWDTIASFTYVKDIGTYSNRLSFNKNTGIVTISPNLLQYNHGYAIYFEGSNNNGNSDYNETEAVWYYVVPTGSTGTSGTINTDNPTGVDFDFINSIEYLNQTSSGNTQFIINSSLSQWLSGDIGYVAPSDNQTHYGFLHQMFVDLIDLLQVNSTTSSITINVHGYDRTLYAADFITPNNSLKTFVQLFLVVGCFFLLYQQFMGIYLSLITLDLHGFIRSQDVDFTFFM